MPIHHRVAAPAGGTDPATQAPGNRAAQAARGWQPSGVPVVDGMDIDPSDATARVMPLRYAPAE